MTDKDGDFNRNAETLSGKRLLHRGGNLQGAPPRPGASQTIKTGRPGPLFAVMHDDEDMSFDNAVAALKTYGGTLVAVETGGKRNQDGIDPNRNFSADGVGCKKLGKDATPKFTGSSASSSIRASRSSRFTTIPESASRPAGVGHVSMDDVPKDMEAHASNDQNGPLAGDRTLVLLTSPVPVSTTSKAEAAELSAKGINAVIESVRRGQRRLLAVQLHAARPATRTI